MLTDDEADGAVRRFRAAVIPEAEAARDDCAQVGGAYLARRSREKQVRDALEAIILHQANALTAVSTHDTPATPNEQYVTLQQVATYLQRNKRAVANALNADPEAPLPDVEGGGGRSHQWRWSRLRPWLLARYNRPLPERFPSLNPS